MASKASDVKDLSLAEQGRGRIEWAFRKMPMMRSLIAGKVFTVVGDGVSLRITLAKGV